MEAVEENMQVDKAGKGRKGDEKKITLQLKEEMMKRGRKRE